jgi:hypothetical protein
MAQESQENAMFARLTVDLFRKTIMPKPMFTKIVNKSTDIKIINIYPV